MTDEPLPPPKILSTREVYRNPWLRVREDKLEMPGGHEAMFGVVEMKPGVTVLPLGEDDEVTLVAEYKVAVGRESLELISGGIDEGETAVEAGARELAEEAGLLADDWTNLGVLNPFTSIVESPNSMYLARTLSATASAPDPGEQIRIVRMPLAEAVEKVMGGEISHGASCVALLKAARLIEGGEGR